jgi:hypothetical protein
MSKRRGDPDNIDEPRVVSQFDRGLKGRVVEFIRKEKVADSMMDFLRLASEFYLGSYERSGGVVKRRFPVRSAVEEKEVAQKARDEISPSKRHRVS